MAKSLKNVFEMQAAIPDERAAVKYFSKILWKGWAFCPHCKNEEIYHFSDGVTFKCAECRKRFSIRVGTIFEDSKIEIRKWLYAIWMLTSHKKGIASTTLARDIGVTQKTAWFMLQRLRYAARTRSFNRRLRSEVEADETRVGGSDKWRHSDKKKGAGEKSVVLGILERGGELRAKPLEHVSEAVNEIINNVAPRTKLITDEWRGFVGFKYRFDHHVLNHRAKEYARPGGIHTNSIEGFWSLLKRQIYGIHHYVSAKHLGKYVDEAVFRYNRRNVGDKDRVAEFLGRVQGRLTYKALIA